MSPGLALAGPITRAGARAAARRELAKPAYRDDTPWWARPVHAVLRWLSDRLQDLQQVTPGGWGGLLVLAGLVAIVVVAVVVRAGRPLGRGRATGDPLATGAALDAADHRRAADAHAAAGAWALAVRERLRATIRELEQRGVLDRRPGRTAGEVAAEAGALLPAVADGLARAARTFDDVWYGEHPATQATYELVSAVDRAVVAARPRPAAAPVTADGLTAMAR